MVNLLEETRDAVGDPKNVLWVGSQDGEFAIFWKDFEKIANFDYDNGYGLQYIATDLVVVFTDGSWLARAEYDGAEGWEHYRAPVIQPDSKPFTKLKGENDWGAISYEPLDVINRSRDS